MNTIHVNEIPPNLSASINAKRYHVVLTDRKMFVAGQKWAEGYDLTNSWIYSANDLNDANRVAAWHYVSDKAIGEEYGIDHPVRIIDTQTGTYLDIKDDFILKVYIDRRAHEGWLNLLKVLSADENMALFAMLDEAVEIAANDDISRELADICSELMYVDITE